MVLQYTNTFDSTEGRDQARKLAEDKVKYACKDKDIVVELYDETEFGRLFAYILRGKKAKPITKGGYYFAYVVNLDVPDFSEYGDVYIQVNPVNGAMRRCF